MNARSWFVLTAVCTLVCTSGCGSARWGSRHSRLRMPSGCVESSCDDPTCEICSPLPPLYDGMARNHRLNRRAHRGHGRHNHGGCSCGSCGGEWFDGEIIEGEIIGGDCFGGCSSCMSGGDGMVMDGGMPMEMMSSGGCQTCQHQGMSGSQMMPSPSHEMHYEQQPTQAVPRSTAPPAGSPPTGSTVPEQMAPGVPMEPQPMGSPMTSMRTPNYGAALFTPPPVEPQPYIAPPSSTPIMYEQQAAPMPEPMPAPPAPPLASPAAHAAPMYLAPPQTSTAMPALPAPMMMAETQPSEVYVPNSMPIQPQTSTVTAASGTLPGKKPMRPFSESAKPRQPAAQPQWEASLQIQTIQPADGSLPALP